MVELTWSDLKRLENGDTLMVPPMGPQVTVEGMVRRPAIYEALNENSLADVLELQPISLVRLLDRLVEHGLLERRHDPRDRRANRLFLTTSGRQLVDDLDSLRDAIASDVLQDVPDPAIKTSLKALQDIKERIKALADPPGHIAAK